MEEPKIKVYIKVNENDEIIEINSNLFIDDLSGWIMIDEGFGDRFAHAQSQYLSSSLKSETGNYQYIYKNNVVIKKDES